MKTSIKLATIAVALFSTLFYTSCDPDDDSNSVGCEAIACTDVFVTIGVSIKDMNDAPVALDAFKVINTQDNSEVTIMLSPSDFEQAQQLGEYPIMDDANINENQELQLEFKGFIGGGEVISSNYTVSSDCCHVDLVSGDLELEL